MLRHIVLQKFKSDASPEQRAALRAAVERMAASVPEVRSLVCGSNIGSGPNHHDFAVVIDFDDMPAFRRYIESPAHRTFVAEHAGIVEKLAAIQHEW